MSGFQTSSDNRTFYQPDDIGIIRKPDVRFSDIHCTLEMRTYADTMAHVWKALYFLFNIGFVTN